jgi:hypothetical protein
VTLFRDEVVQHLEKYVERQLRKGTATYTVFVDHEGVQVDISCHNLNFKNYWGGEWLSSWYVSTTSKSANGAIKVHNHYFEQGNIQFNLSKNVPETTLSQITGKSIVDFIDKNETKVRDLLFDKLCSYSIKKGLKRCTAKYQRNC